MLLRNIAVTDSEEEVDFEADPRRSSSSEASSIDFETQDYDHDQTAEWKQQLDKAFGRRQELEEAVGRIVVDVDRARKRIMEAANLHAQRREAHADTVARLERRMAQLVQDRQASGPLQLNGFTLRKADSHNHVEPSTEEDEAKYLEAAIRASLSFQRSQEQLLETPKVIPHTTMRMPQTAPPKYGDLLPLDHSGDEEEGGMRDFMLNEPGSDADDPSRSEAVCAEQEQHLHGLGASSLVPRSEPRRPQRSDNLQPCSGGPGPWDSRRGGIRGAVPPQSAQPAIGHAPISPASVHRAFELNSAHSLPMASEDCVAGSSHRPALVGSAAGEWLDDMEEQDPEPPCDPTLDALARVGSHIERQHEEVEVGGELVLPQKMEAVSCLHHQDSGDFIDGDVTDADLLSDHDTGGEEEPHDPRQWSQTHSDADEDERHPPQEQAVERAQARSHAGRAGARGRSLLNGAREGAVTPPLPPSLEAELWGAGIPAGGEHDRRRAGVALGPTSLADQGQAEAQGGEEMAGGRSGGGGRARRFKPPAPKKVVVNVQTQTKTFRVVVTPNDTWAHLCALVQAEMAFRDPPQLSADGWTREPKPFTLIKDLPGMAASATALQLRWPASFA